MPAPGGRRRELVEEREICASAARPKPVHLGTSSRRERPPGTASRPGDGAKLHPEHANVARRPMPSPGRLASVLLRRRVPVRTRSDLLRAEVRRRIRPKSAYTLRYGRGHVFLSHSDYAIDWESFKWVVADEAYPTDYEGAVVLDLGAHKGYYGAHALARGARTVISFEPETANLELLEAAAAAYRARGADWRIRSSAVGAERGEAVLRVMEGSWAHSLHPPDSWARYEVGTQAVPLEAMVDLLGETACAAERVAPDREGEHRG